jgi:hypothetical protein
LSHTLNPQFEYSYNTQAWEGRGASCCAVPSVAPPFKNIVSSQKHFLKTILDQSNDYLTIVNEVNLRQTASNAL